MREPGIKGQEPGTRRRVRPHLIPGSWPLTRLLWLVAGLLVALLCMRFAMRALGVREDIPFPGLVYSLTAPLVAPFYRFFPVSPRFDLYAVEMASLAAAAVIMGLTILVYLAVLCAGAVFAAKAEVK